MNLAPACRATVAIVGATVLLAGAACTPMARYRALIVFFDEVPVPGAAGESLTIEGRAEGSVFPDQNLPPDDCFTEDVTVGSIHEPVRTRQCRVCHGRKVGQPASMSVRVCDKCHKEERIQGKWDHGPIGIGTCVPCHQSHQSPYPHLLDRPVPELCKLCHSEDMSRDKPYHDVPNIDECSSCHHPHRSRQLRSQG